MNALLHIVGYGVQNFVVGGGPCDGPCVPRVGDRFTRYVAETTLIQSNDRIADMFLRLHANSGGFCRGDSGGPALAGDANVVVALATAVLNSGCDGITYAYRIDRADALDFIATTAAAYDAPLGSIG
jgi:hypothetical protein